jgi:hypothetical protein
MLKLVVNRESEGSNEQTIRNLDALYTVHSVMPDVRHENGSIINWYKEDVIWNDVDFSQISPEFHGLPEYDQVDLQKYLSSRYFTADEVQAFRKYEQRRGWHLLTCEWALPLDDDHFRTEMDMVEGTDSYTLPFEGEEHLLPFKVRAQYRIVEWLPDGEIPERNKKFLEDIIRMAIQRWNPDLKFQNILVPKGLIENICDLGFYVCMNSNKV